MGKLLKRAVIFCWSESDRPPVGLKDGDFVICADSGTEYARRLGIKPDIILGDFDSYFPSEEERAKAIVLPQEKDDTDTMYAVKYAVEKGFEEIVIAGGIGGREDHTKGAVSALKFIRKYRNGYISDGYTTVNIVNDGETLVIPYDESVRYISVFPRGFMTSGVSLGGVKYPVSDFVLTDDFPLGVSNEQCKGCRSIISCEKGGLEVYIVRP